MICARFRGVVAALVVVAHLSVIAGCAKERALVTRRPLADDKVGFGFFSHSEGGGAQRNHKHWDNFSLVRDANITGVRFWGLSDGTVTTDLENFASFTVEIWSEGENGAPGERIAWMSAPLEGANPRATGRYGIGGPAGAGTGAEYEFTMTFEEPVSLSKDTEYFLSVVAARIDKAADNFMWSDGQRDDGISFSWSYNQEQMIRVDDTDSALVILGRTR